MKEEYDIERVLKGKQKGGRLERWHRQILDSGQYIVWGDVFDDDAGRFYDGQNIHTSLVVKHHTEDRIIETLNSYYVLGKPRGVDLTKRKRITDEQLEMLARCIV